ncbi:HEAT repeat domain-containing protein [Polyangium jinanense]|uniref:HEAT repeat domain-containing protein n=1 Tax=Polyangium jinanense TaxID=2829994 RepID=A0A9X3XDM0_9BACT|nr:HEAT repeat domain-containing protein [Polyangium jinanense]MDC3959557.1 HEAT repeat domain-containing protein [Polyangium jinanense]MDC3986156.1 HEAT repeat domain-containing protein [Polyangium jinanense]
MFDVSSLCWTSRDEVGERLLSWLDLPGRVGLRAARLLALLAPPSLAPALTRIATDPARSFWHRGYALRALARASVGLSDETFARLLDEALMDGPRAPFLELVPFARSGARLAALLARFDRETPLARRAWLRSTFSRVDKPCEELEAWLVSRWLEDVAQRSPDEDDASLAFSLADMYPETLAVLAAYRRARPRDAELFEDIRHFPDLANHLDDETRAAAAAALVLPRRDLLRFSSLAKIRKAARKAVLDHNFALFCPIDKPWTTYGYRGALALLEEDENGPAMAADLLAHARLHEAARADLGLVLYRRKRRIALQYLEQRGAAPENLELARALLREIAKNPDTRDRPALLAALRFPDPEARFLALDVLDAVAEDGPTFRAALESLAEDPDPFVRLRMTGALAYRGHASHVQPLVEAARSSADAILRALAIRLLGRLDEAPDHLDLFERALLEDHAAEEPDGPTPAAEQAAIALGCVGPKAVTALLRGHLLAPSDATLDAVEAALLVLLAEMEGAPLTASARRQEITIRDGGRCTSWSPFRSPGWWW